MDLEDRNTIKRNLIRLVDVIQLDNVVKLLIDRNVFSNEMLKDILTENTIKEKKQKLLLELCTRGPHAFRKFTDILCETNQYEAAKILDPTVEIKRNLNAQAEPIVTNEPQYTEDNDKKVIQATRWMKGEWIYPMTSYPRGPCIIINNVNFISLEPRLGSDVDAQNLEKLFTELGFTVHLGKDLKAEEMLIFMYKIISELRSSPDCCVVILLSHGAVECVYGTDEETLNIYRIADLFNNKNAQHLQKKPKIFFIQACQGENSDFGVEECTQKDAGTITPLNDRVVNPPPKFKSRIPTVSDVYFSLSSNKGYVSQRNTVHGAWYCQELLYVFSNYAHEHHLDDMINMVTYRIKKRINQEGEFQTPERRSIGWTKKLYFNPGLYET